MKRLLKSIKIDIDSFFGRRTGKLLSRIGDRFNRVYACPSFHAPAYRSSIRCLYCQKWKVMHKPKDKNGNTDCKYCK